MPLMTYGRRVAFPPSADQPAAPPLHPQPSLLRRAVVDFGVDVGEDAPVGGEGVPVAGGDASDEPVAGEPGEFLRPLMAPDQPNAPPELRHALDAIDRIVTER